jgi:hypothetical protein
VVGQQTTEELLLKLAEEPRLVVVGHLSPPVNFQKRH